jgi:hypothetical protein
MCFCIHITENLSLLDFTFITCIHASVITCNSCHGIHPTSTSSIIELKLFLCTWEHFSMILYSRTTLEVLCHLIVFRGVGILSIMDLNDYRLICVFYDGLSVLNYRSS